MNQTNFLIGRGELLTRDIVGPRRKPGKAEVYTFAQARELLIPQFRSAAQALDELPADACPGDFAVARLMMNPSFIARSYFPSGLLRSTGLESIGSRTVRVKPKAWTRKGEPQETTTTELFVAGKRQAFRRLSQWTEAIGAQSDEGDDLTHIEQFAAFAPADRIMNLGGPKDRFFEVGLHLLPDEDPGLIQKAFVKFAKREDVKVHTEDDFVAGNLWFVPVEGGPREVERLAGFAFVRVIRPVPKLRSIRPVQRSGGPSVLVQEALFFDSAGWGFSPRTLAARNEDRKVIEGIPVVRELWRDQRVYGGAMLRTFLEGYVENDRFDVALTLDGKAHGWTRLTDLIVKGTRVYGGLWVLDPTSAHDDGAFEVVPMTGRRDWLSKAMVRLDASGQLEEALRTVGVSHSAELRGAHMDFRSTAAPAALPLYAQMDGEEFPATARAHIDVLPRALRLIVPHET